MEHLSKSDKNLLLDKLTLHMLDLVEQEVQLKIQIEKIIKEGELNLAKTRYTKGSNSISVMQLPTEDSKEFKALSTVEEAKNDIGSPEFRLNRHPIDKEAGFIDPSKWFGVLMPASFSQAKNDFNKGVDLSVECANVQVELATTMRNIESLKKEIKSS
ncbi:coiled-coil domain-containing protein 115 [Culicoides brevitarsis]|uniref:coiled-coil domain-containing protein 115 n=1 Tax=Culicoides brevitarsis TaxID=469753 RepID=UPI00307B77CA